MKISPVFVAAVAAKAPAPRGSAPRVIRTCGGSITGQLETNIQSYGYPGLYASYLDCWWTIQHDCAVSYTITPNAFNVEGISDCRYDYLDFSSDGTEQTLTFCGGPSYGWQYYTTYGDNLIYNGGISDPFTVVGNELTIHFNTDHMVTRTGFDLDIVANCAPDEPQTNEPPTAEFVAAFDEFETVMRAAFDALPWQPPVPMLAITKERFAWFENYSDAPCANPAGQGPGAGDDYVPAVIDSSDLCGTVFSFHDALFGYYDDFVCNDRAAEADNRTKYRMRTEMPALLAETKVVFNRFLNKLSCEERIPIA